MRIREEALSMERLDGEIILINFDSGQYFSLTSVSADILWLIRQGVPRDQWLGILERAFPGVPASSEVDPTIDAFLAELKDAGIIDDGAVETGESSESLPDDYVRTAWLAPALEANHDLVDLLLIDPIHDVGDDGWPQLRST